MTSQWQNIRQNIGTWHGAFTQFSPEGNQVSDTPSVLTLEEISLDKTMALTLTRSPTDGPEKVNRLTFTAPGPAPYTYFFESGAFSQGSAQWSSFGQFGTEVSLKVGDRRVRYVIMYEGTPHYTSKLKYVTLIGETQTGGPPFDESTLTLDQLLGHWQGHAEILAAATGEMTAGNSDWQLTPELALTCTEPADGAADEHRPALSLFSDSQATLTSENVLPLKETSAEIAAGTDATALTYQLMLLPKGAYCLLPQEICREQAFRIEVGWLGDGGRRERLIRYYDTRGVWMASALITDRLIPDRLT
ncbi:MAG: DUF3598 family protein [Cyanobacteria bacterium J06598_3]